MTTNAKRTHYHTTVRLCEAWVYILSQYAFIIMHLTRKRPANRTQALAIHFQRCRLQYRNANTRSSTTNAIELNTTSAAHCGCNHFVLTPLRRVRSLPTCQISVHSTAWCTTMVKHCTLSIHCVFIICRWLLFRQCGQISDPFFVGFRAMTCVSIALSWWDESINVWFISLVLFFTQETVRKFSIPKFFHTGNLDEFRTFFLLGLGLC